jgi:uncharacterized membrane protein
VVAQDQDKPRLLAQRLALATLAVVVITVGGAAMLNAPWPGSALLAAVLVLPLLLPLKGLLHGDRRTYAWATLCIAPAFLYAITEAIANSLVRAIAAAILLASLAHFVALVAYLRVTRPQTGSQAGPSP